MHCSTYQVWWNFISSFAKIQFNHGGSVNWVSLVWIYNDAKQSRVSVDKLSFEPNFQVVEYGSIVKIRQIGHILTLFKFWRIDLSDFLRFENFFLKNEHCFVSEPYFIAL